MTKEDIGGLIKQIKDLQIQQSTITRTLHRRLREENVITDSGPTRAIYPIARPQRPLKVGDTVHVANAIKPLPGKAASVFDKEATVTEVTESRVHFETVSGIRTWRAPKNLLLTKKPGQP